MPKCCDSDKTTVSTLNKIWFLQLFCLNTYYQWRHYILNVLCYNAIIPISNLNWSQTDMWWCLFWVCLCFIIDCFHDRQFCLDCIVRSHSRKPKCSIIYTLTIRPLPMFCLCRAYIRKQKRAWHLTPPHPELSCQGGFLSRKHWGCMTSVFWYLNISKSCARDQTEERFLAMTACSFEMFLYKYFYVI